MRTLFFFTISFLSSIEKTKPRALKKRCVIFKVVFFFLSSSFSFYFYSLLSWIYHSSEMDL